LLWRLSTVLFGGKNLIFLFGFIFTNCFPHCFEESTEEMARDSQSAVKFVNHPTPKIDVVKFDDKNNIWDVEV